MFSTTQALANLQQKISDFPHDAAILGTGWNEVIKEADVEAELGYDELFGVGSSVPGHLGKLVITSIGGQRVAVMVGRFHRYEELSSREVTLPIRVFAQAGAKRLLLTAAAGAVNEKYQVGDFVILSDLLTVLLPDSPLQGAQFLDLSEAFNPQLRQLMRQVAVEEKLPLVEGVYAYYHGPNFETPADKMAIKMLGADVVGMSTVPETIMARWEGLSVTALAFVTNLAFVKHDHQDVLAASQKGSQQMVRLLSKYYSQINQQVK